MTEDDRQAVVDAKGVITLPAAATSNPTKSGGRVIFQNSFLGGKQLHYSRGKGSQPFEYTFEAPTAGKYRITARVSTPSWKQGLTLVVNGSSQAVDMPLPYTVGMWENSEPVEIELAEGSNVLRFNREGDVKGVSIRDFTLTPVKAP